MFATAAAPSTEAVPVPPVCAWSGRYAFSTSQACAVLGMYGSATWSPEGMAWATSATVRASLIMTAVMAVAARPPSNPRAMVGTMFFGVLCVKSRDDPAPSNGLTTDCYGAVCEEPFGFGADSAVRTSFGSNA